MFIAFERMAEVPTDVFEKCLHAEGAGEIITIDSRGRDFLNGDVIELREKSGKEGIGRTAKFEINGKTFYNKETSQYTVRLRPVDVFSFD